MMRFCRSPETAFSLSVLSNFCSVSPVAAHPFGEIAIVVVVVIHDESRQEPEGHGGKVVGASSPGRETSGREDEDDAG